LPNKLIHPDKSIILFDGICSLCTGFVRFVIKRDRGRRFAFATLQSHAAKTILPQHNLEADSARTIALIEQGKCYTMSTAALRIVRRLDNGWKLFYVLMLVPRVIRDGVYAYVARHRYGWFGERGSCMIPTPDIADRFLK
jgi:predicted DCC family thiol-disulfide oxidoreductase YuxK